jgi:hypothetical protein
VRTCTHTRTHIHTYTHAHIHTHTCTHTHTHTHTHIYAITDNIFQQQWTYVASCIFLDGNSIYTDKIKSVSTKSVSRTKSKFSLLFLNNIVARAIHISPVRTKSSTCLNKNLTVTHSTTPVYSSLKVTTSPVPRSFSLDTWCLRCGSAAARLLGLWARILPRAYMSVSCECRVSSEFSTTDWSLVQRSPNECSVCMCVIECY